MNRNRLIIVLWIFCLLLAAVVAVFFSSHNGTIISLPEILIFVSLFFVSSFCEYIDSSLGMGYGTTLTPLLLTLGIARVEIVPAILLSEFLTGLFAGIAHHKEGNVDLKNDNRIRRAILLLAIPSVIGVLAATIIGSKLKSFGQQYANLYIGIMIVSIGIYLIYNTYILNRRKLQPEETKGSVSNSRLMILGTIAAFNKGVSGGGYGPLMTGGQLTAGIKEKEAVAVTSLCECFTCLMGLLLFFSLGGSLSLFYAVPLCMGSAISVVPAAKTIKILPKGFLKKSIGWATLCLGILTLWKFLH